MARAAAGQFANSPGRRSSALNQLDDLPPITTPPRMREESQRNQDLRQQLRESQEKARILQITVEKLTETSKHNDQVFKELSTNLDNLEAEKMQAQDEAKSYREG